MEEALLGSKTARHWLCNSTLSWRVVRSPQLPPDDLNDGFNDGGDSKLPSNATGEDRGGRFGPDLLDRRRSVSEIDLRPERSRRVQS